MQNSHRFSILNFVLNPEAVEGGVSKQVIWTWDSLHFYISGWSEFGHIGIYYYGNIKQKVLEAETLDGV